MLRKSLLRLEKAGAIESSILSQLKATPQRDAWHFSDKPLRWTVAEVNVRFM